ncbi:hypothetical protein E3T43_07455 [Cryobacterium sp. Hh7]|uniref:hypothetical protein n=1 Tax=Cryobacterium sp. Hh7 TaxID=1259159 RepID=UPI00106961CA|nr:hypothetical protein [Cryobacterium sp. Hh7]TFD58074.1 hypothetical protein E3T43_07455 [Cryobacterium sp. Hh7]
MTPPTPRVRRLTYERDGFACVTCRATENLEWQHRESSGHGGRGKKAPKLTPADGMTTCETCNPRYEGDLQAKALRCGWKLRRNRQMSSHDIPYFSAGTESWWLPDILGGRRPIREELALELIEAAGGLYSKGAA